MARASDSNECHRCPDHGSIRVDGPVTLKLCQRCWLEWQGSAIRGQVQKGLGAFLATGYLDAAPRNIREELTD
jgi:hypothetical protein